ncbi:MAG: OB-fold nucleic acid binding domain-containing protein, partial [Euryarchaeota archaeon]|nr:OB-fold nucleic acid binding domain-containing protein [Euryarchaeota archaeon]
MAEYSNLEEIRLGKIEALQEQGINPYPRRVERTHTNLEAIHAFEKIKDNEDAEPIHATLVGRVRSMRPMGKITFAHIEDGTSRIQLFFRANDIGADQVKFFDSKFDLGDFVQA